MIIAPEPQGALKQAEVLYLYRAVQRSTCRMGTQQQSDLGGQLLTIVGNGHWRLVSLVGELASLQLQLHTLRGAQ